MVKSQDSETSGFPASRFVAALLSAAVLVAFVRAGLHWIRFRVGIRWSWLGCIVPDPQSTWARVNQSSNTDWAVVFLADGSMYVGWIDQYTFNPNVENQDFLLGQARRVEEDLTEKYTVSGIGVYLNTRDVKRIEFIEGKPPDELSTAEAPEGVE